MKKPNLPMAALLVALLAAGASAAAPASKAAARMGGGAEMTQAEFTAQRVKRSMRLDGDGDGKISLAEWSSRPMGPNAGGKRDPAKAFARLDQNKDGLLDEGELTRISDRAFTRLDTNRDGRLSLDEQKAVLTQRQAALAK